MARLPEYTSNHWLEYLRLELDELESYCEKKQIRGSGKGGQKRNKTSNAIQLKLLHLHSSAGQYRSLQENLTSALRKLRIEIAADFSNYDQHRRSLDCPPEIKPYLQQQRISINPKNQHFEILFAYTLDVLVAKKGNLNEVSAILDVTNSQLRKFLQSKEETNQKYLNVLKSIK